MKRNMGLIATFILLLATLFWGYKLHGGDVWPSIWAVVLGLAVVVTLVVVSSSYEEFLNYFVFALCGGTLGWVIGIIASPSTAEEERVFGEYKTAIMAFVSGFAVTKLNDLWKLLTDDKDKKPLILQTPVLSRLLLFFGMFFLLVAQQYNMRQSHTGGVIVSAAVTPSGALAGQTKAELAVRPGAVITLKGAAEAPDMDVDWSVNGGSPFSKAVGFDNAKITVPDAATLASAGVKDGDELKATATSRWNHAKAASFAIVVRLDKTASPTDSPK
jgi:hypothetical protein